MKEKLSEVVAVRVDLVCPHCGGVMVEKLTYPNVHVSPATYGCENCGYQESSTTAYPHITFMSEEELKQRIEDA